MTYTDVLHIYGLSRAGYIPQLFSLRLPNPTVIFELLQKANAKALIFDPSFAPLLESSPVPTHVAVNAEDVEDSTSPIPALPTTVNGGDKVFVFHTSGSTSGSPKLVPCSYRWLDTIVGKAAQIMIPNNPSRQDVTVWMYVISLLHRERSLFAFSGEACVTSDKHSVSSSSILDALSC
jgi:acyl-CoA synthetase (AMP-forming)/AMP-acid ligase II